MKEVVRRLKKWSKDEPQPPIGIELAPTLRCNISCKFCWRFKKNFDKADEELRKREMSKDRYIKIIKEAASMGVDEIKIIGGGESMYRDDTIDIMKEVKANDMYGYICTNGSLFSRDDLEVLDNIGWDYIKISLHGLKETHNDLTRSHAFEKVIENIMFLKNTDIEVEIGMVVVNENYEEISELLELARDLGAENFFLEPITIYSKLGDKLALSKNDRKQLISILNNVKGTAKKYDINTNFEEFIDDNLVESTNDMVSYILNEVDQSDDSFANLPCYEPFLRMGIRVDGRVAPCGFFDYERGDSVKDKSLSEVWYGKYFEKRREEQINKKLPPYCSKCCTTLVKKQSRVREKLKDNL